MQPNATVQKRTRVASARVSEQRKQRDTIASSTQQQQAKQQKQTPQNNMSIPTNYSAEVGRSLYGTNYQHGQDKPQTS